MAASQECVCALGVLAWFCYFSHETAINVTIPFNLVGLIRFPCFEPTEDSLFIRLKTQVCLECRYLCSPYGK
ncbi:hypothetical protein F4820DRAFT_403335 [Hypoxylon rubiginosum]|uniref:Uncharacterized protein n=1 Tax=Hypoxylon rubiginosum TaxID=110542 RepID=A0ACB9ZFF7_9PEZI|nr:hypothetical protein F4820DRAFT_403335 [Hypoxylon rubiginosum]